MCEFRVRMADSGDEVMVDVVAARLVDGTLVLRDVMGSKKEVDGVVIGRIDVGREEMELIRLPAIKELIDFYRLCERIEREGRYSDEIERVWEEVKAKGDAHIRDLWRRFGKD